jgi:peptidoglycan hydrolase-like protein with peptidoglycan-binding domain
VVVVSSDVHRADQWFPVSTTEDVACVLRGARTGEAVRTLQVSLNSCYRAKLVEDGIFGPRTRRALAGVQRSLGLPGNGVYGPRTRDAMYRDGGIAWLDWTGTGRRCSRLDPLDT